jgi:hypothetical protein
MSRGDVSVPPRLTAVAGPCTGATGWSSAAHGSSMSHEEVEFCAEEELVTIVPAFRKDVPLALLGGQYGPFRPQVWRAAREGGGSDAQTGFGRVLAGSVATVVGAALGTLWRLPRAGVSRTLQLLALQLRAPRRRARQRPREACAACRPRSLSAPGSAR